MHQFLLSLSECMIVLLVFINAIINYKLTFILLCEIVIWFFYIYFQFSSYVLVI